MIRVLLAEDANLVRGALVALLGLEHDIEVVAEIERGDEIEAVAVRVKPDVAVLDIDLPGVDGITASVALRTHLPACRIVILTGLGRPGMLRRALDAKVDGFLSKDAPPRELADAVRQVMRGERVIDRQLALAAWDTGDNPLTPREAEVLQMAGAGASVGEIAAELFLSAGTVRNYLTNCVSKLNARNRMDAFRVAEQANWLS